MYSSRLYINLVAMFLIVTCNGNSGSMREQDVLIGRWEVYKWTDGEGSAELIENPIAVEYRRDILINHSSFQRCMYRLNSEEGTLSRACGNQTREEFNAMNTDSACPIQFLSKKEFVLECPSGSQNFYYHRRLE